MEGGTGKKDLQMTKLREKALGDWSSHSGRRREGDLWTESRHGFTGSRHRALPQQQQQPPLEHVKQQAANDLVVADTSVHEP